MKSIIVLFIVLFCSTASAAELLVMAKDGPHWSHAKKYEVVSVQPDGTVWGKGDCLPTFIVGKFPGWSVEDAKKYVESLTEVKTEQVIETVIPVSKRLYNEDIIASVSVPDARLTTAYDDGDKTRSIQEKIVASYPSAEVVGEREYVYGKDKEGQDLVATAYDVVATKETVEVVRDKKYVLPANEIDTAIAAGKSVFTVKSLSTFISGIREKSLADEKAAVTSFKEAERVVREEDIK